MNQELYPEARKELFNLDKVLTGVLVNVLNDNNVKYMASRERMPLNLAAISEEFVNMTMNCNTEYDFNMVLNMNFYNGIYQKYLQELNSRLYPAILQTCNNDYNRANFMINDLFNNHMFNMRNNLISVKENNTVDFIIKNNMLPKIIRPPYIYNPGIIAVVDYMEDIITSAYVIAKLCFVQRQINKVKEDSEFASILKRMSTETDNFYKIIADSKQLYESFYANDYGNITSINTYYMLVKGIFEKFDEKKGKRHTKCDSFQSFDEHMKTWLDKEVLTDPKSEIIEEIYKSVDDKNLLLLFNSLTNVQKYVQEYNQVLIKRNNQEIRDKYMKDIKESKDKEKRGLIPLFLFISKYSKSINNSNNSNTYICKNCTYHITNTKCCCNKY